jgi:streptogramin lyase
VYVADTYNDKIRKITMGGEVTTLAGSTQGFADGEGSAAQFNRPGGVAVDASGNVYVVDTNNHKIRKITPEGEVTTLAGSTPGFADGTGTAAQFNYPYDLAVDTSGNVYVVDRDNNKIRKITPAGVVTTLAGSIYGYGDGTGSSAKFKSPLGVAVDVLGNVYVADAGNHKIRKITPAGEVTTVAGSTQGFADGAATVAQFYFPTGVAVDASGNVYVADRNNHKIRKITPAGEVTTVAGSTQGFADGTGTEAQFNRPYGVAIDASGNMYVADINNHKIRKITGAVLSNASPTLLEGFVVYPNPSNGVFNIEALNNANLTVYDMTGKQVATQKITIGNTTLNLSSCTAGVYFAQITNENNQTNTIKLIKN